MSAIDRRRFVAFLLAAFAAASAPALAAPGRRNELFILKPRAVPAGSEVWAIAETPDGKTMYGVRCVVTAVRWAGATDEDCWVWAVEYEADHDVFWFCDAVTGSISVPEVEVPDRILRWAAERAAASDLPWKRWAGPSEIAHTSVLVEEIDDAVISIARVQIPAAGGAVVEEKE